MRTAKLRVCASCEWIFKYSINQVELCPKCGFVSYSARYVYGQKAYRYFHTQEPWMRRKVEAHIMTLLKEINDEKKERRSKATHKAVG